METLRAHRLHAHYRLPAHAAAERSRLDRVLRSGAVDMLGLALDRAGFRAHEIVCLRRVHAYGRLELSLDDDALGAAWSLQLAEAIRLAATGARGAITSAIRESEGIVRYRSLAAALEDLVHRVLRRDYARAWAWRQIGFWPSSEVWNNRQAMEWTVAALAQHPGAIVPILTEVARRGLLAECVDRLEPGDWIALARAASAVPGPAATVQFSEPLLEEAQSHIASYIEGVWERSRLLAAVPRSAFRSPILAEALATLALLEREPALRVQPERASALAAALAERVCGMEGDRLGTTDPPSAWTEAEPEARAMAESRFGGLLYLLNLIADLELWNVLFDSTGARTLSWSLHQLAMRLVVTGPDDAAVLAFAGLAPDATPPGENDPAPTLEELALLDRTRALIVEHLQERMPETKPRGDALLDWVCRRSCRLLADPGWIEVRFALNCVSTEIRRARLDLNPGYQPWLGITVMFVYE